MTVMEKPRDVVGGLLVAGIGAGFLLFGRELEVGTSFRMGPGYFPTILAVLMIGLGLAMAVLAWRKPMQEDAIGTVPWLGIALVVVPVVLFGFSLRGLGLRRSWSWWSWPPPGPAATPALRPRCLWPWASPPSARSCSSRGWACPCRWSGPG